jgi:hypothetical protein
LRDGWSAAELVVRYDPGGWLLQYCADAIALLIAVAPLERYPL